MDPNPILDVQEIKRRAEACGVSLKTLAKQAGVSHPAAYRAARRQANPRGKTLRRLTGALLAVEEVHRKLGADRRKIAQEYRRRADELEKDTGT